MKRLVVIPSEPIADYERAGYESWLEKYFNPRHFFDEVYALSPLETSVRQAYGLHICPVSRRNFRSTLEALQPTAIRAYGGFWPADLACANRLPGVPVVVSVHDTNPRLLSSSIRYADAVVCMSRAVRDVVIAHGTAPAQTVVLPNRVNRSLFRPIPANDPAVLAIRQQWGEGRWLLHVGRQTEQKNPDTVIRALALLPADYKCVFVGAPNPSPYEVLARELGVRDRCRWFASVASHQLPLWYNACDCMCTPSRWEGFGIVFIEAAACGAAIVTSARPPMNEYLAHGVSAHLVDDPERPDALALAIRACVEDLPYRNALRSAAPCVAESFDSETVDRQEAALYESLLNRPARELLPREVVRARLIDAAHAARDRMREYRARTVFAARTLMGKRS